MRFRALQAETPRAEVPCPRERDLWLQVIAVAINDARGQIVAKSKDTRDAEAAQRRAAEWLFSPLCQDDFFVVCHLAGLEPEFVREVARRDGRVAWSRSSSRAPTASA